MAGRMSRIRGFTLIELLVAIAAMALLALMSWRGLDGMTRAQSMNRDRGEWRICCSLSRRASTAGANASSSRVRVIARNRAISWARLQTWKWA